MMFSLRKSVLWRNNALTSLPLSSAKKDEWTSNTQVTYDVNKVKPFDEIPGPKPLPIIGNLWRYLPYVGEYKMKRLFETYHLMFRQYGSLVREVVFKDRVTVHAFDRDDIARVYERDGGMPQRRSHRAILKYRREKPDLYNSAGLLPTNGPEWMTFRNKFFKVVLDQRIVDTYTAPLEEVADELVHKIPLICDEKGEVDIQPELFKWSLESIGVVTLNRRFGCLDLKGNREAEKLVAKAAIVHDAIFRTETALPFWTHIPTPAYLRMARAERYFEKVVGRNVNEAIDIIKRDQVKSTLLAQMLAVRDAEYKDVFTMVLDMFIAGIDSTSAAMGFALYNLARNQEVQDKLRALVMEHLPEKNSKLAADFKMPYMSWFLKETLRVNPLAIGIGRVLNQGVILSGYEVPAGTLVILQHQVASLQPENFNNPQEFNPDRWNRKIPENLEKIKGRSMSSLPFGSGTRSCIGRRLAQKEMMTLIAKLLRSYKVEYHHADIGAYTRLINVPDKPVKLRFVPITK